MQSHGPESLLKRKVICSNFICISGPLQTKEKLPASFDQASSLTHCVMFAETFSKSSWELLTSL